MDWKKIHEILFYGQHFLFKTLKLTPITWLTKVETETMRLGTRAAKLVMTSDWRDQRF
jgi:hypothetical protein